MTKRANFCYQRLFFSAFILSNAFGHFRITYPPNFSTIDLAEDGSVTIFFAYESNSTGASIKVDVLGFADPSGWPYSTINLARSHVDHGVIEGNTVLSGLVPGAVSIRIRLLTPDGTDAVGEDSREIFLDALRYFASVFSSQWTHPALSLIQRQCCAPTAGLSTDPEDRNHAFGAAGIFRRPRECGPGGGEAGWVVLCQLRIDAASEGDADVSGNSTAASASGGEE
eukprot:CAMPEP_0113662686 /NCGR_PEP_ID=MMETSP0038_2-20120614/715_1 /TAXON_ID=2898 /ORGANISM="Cryptomonas paramecium" /LENGTH=225 /DNA_ID=CAMNT_0000577611 /DNA_START=15 /DNA_END=689 /DNA_ORIENTATION=+ /assembly_acc=CAM_ASM_000170